MSASSYSFVSLVQRFAPLMNAGGAAINLTYVASNRVIPGYGGGMSSAKAVSDEGYVRGDSSSFRHWALSWKLV
jgi:enoyl-[acyl-carrier-protein] reductase (NADH)